MVANDQQLLDDLEAAAFGVSRHDAREATAARALWIRSLSESEQRHLRVALRRWIEERSHPWHAQEALELAVSMRWDDAIDLSVSEARKRPLTPADELDKDAWFRIDVIRAAERLPTTAAIAYVEELATLGLTASTFVERSIGTRARLALCRVHPSKPCLDEVRLWLNRWNDDRLLSQWGPLLESLAKAAGQP